MTRCSICSHESVAAIDARLDTGVNQKTVAVEFGVSRAAISRHLRYHRASEPVHSENEIKKWLLRADTLYESAILNDDSRAAISALVAGLKAADSQAKQHEREAAKPPEESGPQLTIEMCDQMVAKLFEESDVRTHQLALEKSKELMFDVYVLFERMWENPRLKRDVLRYAREWTEMEEEYVS